jgi:hypothetical protein
VIGKRCCFASAVPTHILPNRDRTIPKIYDSKNSLIKRRVDKMLTVIAYVSLLISIITLIFAIRGAHQLYWISAAGIYIFSFLAGFSIGQFTVGLTFILLALAIGYTLGRIKGKVHYCIFAGCGIVVGIFMVTSADNYWKFLPFWIFLPNP